MATERISRAEVEAAIALYLSETRGIAKEAVTKVEFPVLDAFGNPSIVAHVDERTDDGER